MHDYDDTRHGMARLMRLARLIVARKLSALGALLGVCAARSSLDAMPPNPTTPMKASRGRRSRYIFVVGLVAPALAVASCGAVGNASRGGKVIFGEQRTSRAGTGGDAGSKPGKDPKFQPETPDNALFWRLKGNAKAKGAQQVPTPPAVATAPTIMLNSPGIYDNGWYPSDANGDRSSKGYVEVINNRVGFFSSTLGLLSSDTTFNLAATSSPFVGDPEIIYDPSAQKFFYTMIDQDASGNLRLDYGFSKTANPSSVANFCHYSMPSSGTTLPDYPRLGATKDFLLIGTNNFVNDSYINSSVYWAKKPSSTALTTCPAPPANGVASGFQFTPVPAHQTDPSSVGYILASSWNGGSSLYKYKVTKSTTGTPVFSAATSVGVASYSMPADAPQPGTSDSLSTLDNRLFEVIQSWDPTYNTGVLWTAHNIYGGAGSAVRWYEISTAGKALNSVTIADSTLYYYEGTISPDRVYQSSTAKKFGSDAVIGFNQSSLTTPVGVDVASWKGGLSPIVVADPGSLSVSCGNNGSICRWGDRSSANPALGASLTNPTGRVWLSQSIPSPSSSYATQNLQVAP